MEKQKNQYDALATILLDFVERVSKGKATSDTEIAVLPEVAEVLAKLLSAQY